jgi:hypothetical protein
MEAIVNALVSFLSMSGVHVPANGRVLWGRVPRRFRAPPRQQHIHQHGNGFQQGTNYQHPGTDALRSADRITDSFSGVPNELRVILMVFWYLGPNLQDFSHDPGRISSQLLDMGVKVLDPVLAEGRLSDFNLSFLENIARVSADVAGALLLKYGEVRTDRSINRDRLIVLDIRISLRAALKGGNAVHCGFLTHSERVALFDQFVDNIMSSIQRRARDFAPATIIYSE